MSLEKRLSLKQRWYVPVNFNHEIGVHDFSEQKIEVRLKGIIRKHHKILFFLRAWQTFRWIYRDISNTPEPPDKVHAHFLFTDGAVALFLHWKKQIPFIVSVRNTDINTYFRFAFHLKWFARLILSSAESVVIISPSYRSKLKHAVGQSFYSQIEHKLHVIPNQLEQSWFDARSPQTTKGQINLLYVGDNTRNKRFEIIVELLKKLPDRFRATFVGIESSDLVIPLNINDRVSVLGRVDCEKQLKDIYEKCHILVLPSKHETFGMVAAEALALGRPVLIGAGEGIAGFLEERMPLNCTDFLDFEKTIFAILKIIETYPIQIMKSLEIAKNFREDVVMEEYRKIYLSNER